MPIYDNDGTTSREISKLYDNNGSTSSQISKVYDNNGTTSSLVYTSMDYLYKAGDNYDYTGGWETQMVYAYGSLSVGASSYISIDPGNGETNRYFVNTKKAVDLTNISSLTANIMQAVTASCRDSSKGNWSIYFGLAVTQTHPNPYTIGSGDIPTRVWGGGVESPSRTITFDPGLLSLNVSSCNGLYYVLLYLETLNTIVNAPFRTSEILCY